MRLRLAWVGGRLAVPVGPRWGGWCRVASAASRGGEVSLSHTAGLPRPLFNKDSAGDFPGGPVARLSFQCRGGCSIPGGEAKIPPASPTKKKLKRKRAHRGRSDVSAQRADPRPPTFLSPSQSPGPLPDPRSPETPDSPETPGASEPL